jgi:hypothetical protein
MSHPLKTFLLCCGLIEQGKRKQREIEQKNSNNSE